MYTPSHCASTAAQYLRADPTAGPRLDVAAPLPRFVPQARTLEQTSSIRPPVAVQQAIEAVQVSLWQT